MNFTLLIGYLLDKLLGDPSWLPHPIVYFGKWISMWEHHLNHVGTARKTRGALFSLVSIALTFATSYLIIYYIGAWNRWVAIVLQGILVFYCLAGTTLIREVKWVFEATERSLEEGRRQVGRIVGRNTEELSRQEIHAAALETLAENLSDGVIAPLFWYALLGVPGMLTYKMINTMDSMIGYQNERYKDFGCWAAHIDDLANYLPARLTALLMVLVSHLPHGGTPVQRGVVEQLRFVWHYGPQHASPNSGWPEAALASVLDCRFGGPHYYFDEYFYKPFIGQNERPFSLQDMYCATAINLYAEVFCVTFILIAELTFLLVL